MAPQQRWGPGARAHSLTCGRSGQSRFSLKTDPLEAGGPGPNGPTHKSHKAGRSSRAGKGLVFVLEHLVRLPAQ